MGCQQICQNSDIDNKYIVADTGSKSANNRKIENSRNFNKGNLTKNEYSATNDSNYRCSINIHETLNGLKFIVKATNIHKIVPVWLKKGMTVSFKVSGEWGFFEHSELFDSMGCTSFDEKPNNMNFGCLVGYIPSEPFFTVFDELEYTPKRDGPLLLFQNNGLYSVNPRGYLEVEIKGGISMSLFEIEQKLGWNLSILDTSIPDMKEEESFLLVLINKVRSDPKLFAQQHLTNSKGSVAEIELEELLYSLKPLNPLKTNKNIYEVSKKHALDLGMNKIAGHTSSNGLNMEQRLQEGGVNTKVFAENCIFGYNDPLEILLRLLIDEENENRNQRKIILSPDFNTVGLSIEPHSGEFCWSCIQDFILDL